MCPTYSDKEQIYLELIDEYELELSKKRSGAEEKIRKIAFIENFCNDRNIKWKTFYRHLLNYKKTIRASECHADQLSGVEIFNKISSDEEFCASDYQSIIENCDLSFLEKNQWINIIDRKAFTIALYKCCILLPLLVLDKQGNRKKQMISDIISRKYIPLKGICIKFSTATVYRYLSILKKEGIQGLIPKHCFRTVRMYKDSFTATITINRNNPIDSIRQIDSLIKLYANDTPAKKATNILLEQCLYLSKVNGVKKMKPITLPRPLKSDEIKLLEVYANSPRTCQRNRAITLLMANEGKTLLEISSTLTAKISTIYSNLHKFKNQGIGFIEAKIDRSKNNPELAARPNRIIEILHQTPGIFGINRTSWILADIAKIYSQKYEHSLSTTTIRRTIKKLNYSWRRARRVLTSNDPEFKQKAQKVLDTLRDLSKNDAFFFIDEAGPWLVKKYGGKILSAPGVTKKYPDSQTTKGRITFIAGLNAIENQVSWVFIDNKDSNAVILFINKLHSENYHCSKIFITWDCASWHSSTELTAHINKLNDDQRGPQVVILPLPKKTQYLNVIESVFGGLKRAVIHNSDYSDGEQMKMAISRHFHERNEYFKNNPKRAGQKIWDAEVFNFDDFCGGLHKHV